MIYLFLTAKFLFGFFKKTKEEKWEIKIGLINY